MLSALLVGAVALVLAAPAAAQAQIAVGDAQASEAAGSITFTISRQASLLAPAVTVAFATANGTASAGSDYTAASGSRTFPAALLGGAQVQHVTVAVTPDALDEPDETLRLIVSGNGVGDGDGAGTIVDDDAPPAIRVADAPAAGEGTTAQFTVALSRPSGRNVSVAYTTVDGSAVAGEDYGARAGTVTLAPGATSATVGVPLLDDSVDEPNESFALQLGAPSFATLGDASAHATIVDDDEPAAAPQGGAPPPPPAPPAGGSTAQPPALGGSSASGSLPRLGLSSPRLRQPATVLVTISCPRQSGRCRGRMTIFSRPNRRSKIKALRLERRLGRSNFSLPGGGAQTLRIALSRRDRVLLRRAGRIRVRAYVVTSDAAGRTGVRQVNGTLVARTSHSG